MSTSFELGCWHGLAMLCVAATVPVNLWMMMNISSLRRKHGIKYPQMTSDKHQDFNCAQRVHHNTLELLPFYLATLFTASIRHPMLASLAGVAFLVGRVMYGRGYYTGDPAKRMPGFRVTLFGGIAPLFLLSISSAAGILGWW